MDLLTTEDMDQDDSSPFSAVTGSKMRTAIASMPADKGAYNNVKTNIDNVDIHHNNSTCTNTGNCYWNAGHGFDMFFNNSIFSNCIELSGILILIC